MPFDLSSGHDREPDDCPVCDGWGLIYEAVPLIALRGPTHGQLIAKRACPACTPSQSCPWCAGISSPGFWVEQLCQGKTKLLRRGSHSCPRCG